MQNCECKCEEMYCSQQIPIPPMFPYILRQYAKAAIRTQPNDLLRWSTAYFRCLALNLPPPVKVRLEYPIPKTHFGITPGWLKALLQQYQIHSTISFKQLWDKWMGACLHHRTLIEILCLGGFTDPQAIPWLKFIGLCASHLGDNLTQTMVIVCEIITEEPEGGPAMISLEVFLDVYRFLASIDASEGRYIPNLYFTDSLLSLYREPVEESVKSETIAEEEASVETVEEEQVKSIEEEQESTPDLDIVISCPDIASDNLPTEEDLSVSTLRSEKLEEKPIEDKEQIVEYLAKNKEVAEEQPPDDKAYDDLRKLLELEAPPDHEVALEEQSEEASVVTAEVIEPEEPGVEEVWVESVRGIGGVVPVALVHAVEEYMKECASRQHGMVMPRNLRHYSCPPLEVVKV